MSPDPSAPEDLDRGPMAVRVAAIRHAASRWRQHDRRIAAVRAGSRPCASGRGDNSRSSSGTCRRPSQARAAGPVQEPPPSERLMRLRGRRPQASASVSGEFGRYFALPGGPFSPVRWRVAGGEQPLRSERQSRRQALFRRGRAGTCVAEPRPVRRVGSVRRDQRADRAQTTLRQAVGSTETLQFTAIHAPVRDISFPLLLRPSGARA